MAGLWWQLGRMSPHREFLKAGVAGDCHLVMAQRAQWGTSSISLLRLGWVTQPFPGLGIPGKIQKIASSSALGRGAHPAPTKLQPADPENLTRGLQKRPDTLIFTFFKKEILLKQHEKSSFYTKHPPWCRAKRDYWRESQGFGPDGDGIRELRNHGGQERFRLEIFSFFFHGFLRIKHKPSDFSVFHQSWWDLEQITSTLL